jgi:hypothetical protein
VTRAGARRQLGIVDGWEEDGGGWAQVWPAAAGHRGSA